MVMAGLDCRTRCAATLMSRFSRIALSISRGNSGGVEIRPPVGGGPDGALRSTTGAVKAAGTSVDRRAVGEGSIGQPATSKATALTDRTREKVRIKISSPSSAPRWVAWFLVLGASQRQVQISLPPGRSARADPVMVCR